jgi:hypothetical protein
MGRTKVAFISVTSHTHTHTHTLAHILTLLYRPERMKHNKTYNRVAKP